MARGGYARGTRFELHREFRHPQPGCPRFCAIYEADAAATQANQQRRSNPLPSRVIALSPTGPPPGRSTIPCGGSSIAASSCKRNMIYPIWNIKLADRQETSVRPRVSLALGASISAEDAGGRTSWQNPLPGLLHQGPRFSMPWVSREQRADEHPRVYQHGLLPRFSHRHKRHPSTLLAHSLRALAAV